MNKKRLYCALLALTLLLAGCAAGAAQDNTAEERISVYYIQAEGSGEGGPLLVSESIPAGTNPMRTAIFALGWQPKSPALKSVLPSYAPILSWTLTDGELVLSLSPGYLGLKGMDKTTADYGLALTLCPLEGVDTLSIMVGGEKVTAGLKAEDAVLEDVVDAPGLHRLRLYYADAGGRYLTPEYRMIPWGMDGDIPVERRVMEELLRGPEGENRRSAVPEGTRLLSVYRENAHCTVDLSSEFLANRPETALGERLAIYSLVNTLCDIAGVDSVQILVEGKTLNYYQYLPIGRHLSANPGAVGPAIPARSERDVDIYMALTGTNSLTGVPEKISMDESESLAYALMDKLINGMSRETDYLPLFPRQEGGQQLPKISEPGFSVRVRDGVCTVLLPAVTIEWCNEQGAARLASQAIAHTLRQIPEVRSVYVGCMDGTASFFGVSPLAPVAVNDELVVR